MVVNSEDTVIISTWEATCMLYFDIGGYSYNCLYDLPPYERLGIFDSDLLLGQRNDSIFLFSVAVDSQFHVILNSFEAIGFPGESILDFSISGNHAAILTSGPHAYVYDENLALQSDFALPEGYHFSLIALAPDGVVVTSQ